MAPAQSLSVWVALLRSLSASHEFLCAGEDPGSRTHQRGLHSISQIVERLDPERPPPNRRWQPPAHFPKAQLSVHRQTPREICTPPPPPPPPRAARSLAPLPLSVSLYSADSRPAAGCHKRHDLRVVRGLAGDRGLAEPSSGERPGPVHCGPMQDIQGAPRCRQTAGTPSSCAPLWLSRSPAARQPASLRSSRADLGAPDAERRRCSTARS